MVHLIPQTVSIIENIKVFKLVQQTAIEKISNVFDSQKNLILGLREQMNFYSSIIGGMVFIGGLRHNSVVLSLVGETLVHGKEVL